MEPITTAVAISTVVGYLAKKLKDNKSIQGFFDDLTEATINTIKPIFIKTDGTPEKIVNDLEKNPESTARQSVIESAIHVAIEDNKQVEIEVQKFAALIEAKKARGETVSIGVGKNINTGPIEATGSVIFGDNNKVNDGYSS